MIFTIGQEVLGLYCYCAGCRGFFFCLFNCRLLQQNLAIASFSDFLLLCSNSRRHADSTSRWPLQMTLMCDLDLTVFSHFEPQLRTCVAKRLQNLTEASWGHGHSSDAKMSQAFFMNYIYGYIMFFAISWKHVFGHNFLFKHILLVDTKGFGMVKQQRIV